MWVLQGGDSPSFGFWRGRSGRRVGRPLDEGLRSSTPAPSLSEAGVGPWYFGSSHPAGGRSRSRTVSDRPARPLPSDLGASIQVTAAAVPSLRVRRPR